MQRGARNSDGSVVGIEAVAADVEALRERTRVVCTRLNRTHADLVSITTDLIERSLWAEGGIRSPQHWLMVQDGLSPATARDVVRMARRSRELPEAMDSLTVGTLSLDQASVLTRHVPATHSAAATDLAKRCTVPQLRRVLSRYGSGTPTLTAAPTETRIVTTGTPAPTRTSTTMSRRPRGGLRRRAPGHTGCVRTRP